MRKIVSLLAAAVVSVGLTACGGAAPSTEADIQPSGSVGEAETEANPQVSTETIVEENTMDIAGTEINMESMEEMTEMKMNVQVGDVTFTATLEENAAAHELVEMMRQEPISINMRDYSGFEKVGALGRSLATDNRQTTTSAGDIVLYNGNQIVIFYGSNSWSYTRLGKIDDLTGWADALGSGSVTVTFSLAE